MSVRLVIDDAVLRSCWLASLALACRWKRASRHYLLDAQILMMVAEPDVWVIPESGSPAPHNPASAPGGRRP